MGQIPSHLRISVLGSRYSALPFRESVESILERAKSGGGGYVCIANVHTTMTGYYDPAYQKITNSSFLSTPDGQPIRWAMQCLGAKGQERVRGPSVMKAVCDQGRARGLKHFLYGASPKTLSTLEAALKRDYPGIEIVGAISPPFRPLSASELAADVAAINASGAEIVWIGLGAPKQERWMWDQRETVRPLMMGIGAAFDLLSGVISEAPQWIQSLGLEWLYRLVLEPRRLWRRYLWNNPAFLVLFLRQLFLKRPVDR